MLRHLSPPDTVAKFLWGKGVRFSRLLSGGTDIFISVELNELKAAIAELRGAAERDLAGIREILSKRISDFDELAQGLLVAGPGADLEHFQSQFDRERVRGSELWREGCDAVEQAFTESATRLWGSVVRAVNEDSDTQEGHTTEALHPEQAVRRTPTSEFVRKLRRFLASAEKETPTLRDAHRQYAMAESVLRTLQAQLGSPIDEADSTDLALWEDWFQEAEDLRPMVRELSSLVLWIEAYPQRSAGWKRGRPRASDEKEVSSISSRAVEELNSVPRDQQPALSTSDDSEMKPGAGVAGPREEFHQLDAEMIAAYEKDYFKHVELCHMLRSTSKMDAHFREWTQLQAQLDERRQELTQWRKDGGYTGDKPLFFSDTFKGALPGTSHVSARRQAGKKKKNNQSTERQSAQKKKRKKQTAKRHNRGSRLPFEVWAADSWGKDPDDTPRDRNVVLGGAMESNRSRH